MHMRLAAGARSHARLHARLHAPLHARLYVLHARHSTHLLLLKAMGLHQQLLQRGRRHRKARLDAQAAAWQEVEPLKRRGRHHLCACMGAHGVHEQRRRLSRAVCRRMHAN